MNMDNGHNERMLSAGLKAIASQALPPPSIKKAVMAEFRRVNKVTPIHRPLIRWVAMAAAAAAILVAALVSMPSPEMKVSTIIPPPGMPTPVPVQAPAVPKPHKPHRVVKAQPPAPDRVPEVATDFFQIPYAEPLRPDERVDVLRMQMPRANMAVFGLPVTGGGLDSRVTADVLMGEDGVVRAVRFIR